MLISAPSTDETIRNRVSRHRILVADDGKHAAKMLATFFEIEGLETETALDGAEALEKAAAFKPHLICLDLGMPVMDGYEAARRIRATDPDVVLVAITGLGEEEDIKRALDAGFNSHLLKPVSPVDLRKILSRYLDYGDPQET
jgi:CheY-like chemotaxis protein